MRTIIAVCVIVFFLQGVFPDFFAYLALTPIAFWKGPYLWQAVTYIFMHGSLMHLFLNMFIFWMFGAELEERWGTGYFLRYFLITGIGAGLCSVIADPASRVPIVGASGAISALLVAQAMINPRRMVLLMFFLPLEMKYAVWVLIAVEFLAQVSGSSPGIAHWAHLGGLGVGYLYLKKDDLFQRWRNRYYREKLRKMRGQDDYERGPEEGPPN